MAVDEELVQNLLGYANMLVETAMKQKSVAEAIGISSIFMSNIVTGRVACGQQIRAEIAEYLGKDVDWLFPPECLPDIEK